MKRPFSTLSHAIVGRVYPQHQEWVKVPGFVIGSVDRLIAECVRNPADPLPTALIARGAKLSDLISSAALNNFGLLVSTKTRSVLDGFKLGEHCYVPAPMEHRGAGVEGYWFFYVKPLDVPISEESPPTEVDAILEADSNLADIDLFRLELPARFANWYISAPLKAAMEQAKLTGLRFGTAKLLR
jgi:hypothetical protein